jgi:S-adenosylmethionine:tRNA ribosyltransferase-isomerase
VYLTRVGPQDFDFELPSAQIAQSPAQRRGDAKMLVLAVDGTRRHAQARDLPRFCAEPPLVVLNDSRVVPARVRARRERDAREFELLVCEPTPGLAPGSKLRAWVRKAKKLREGERLRIGDALVLEYLGPDEVDPRARCFRLVEGDLLAALEGRGELPLPPYIARPEGVQSSDLERYQSRFAAHLGSVAAPTAGLHFEEEVLAALDTVKLTLHVGPGTFLPMEVEDVRDHKVGSERFEIGDDAAARIEQARHQGRPILAVGTTVTRTLEGVAKANGGRVVPGAGRTDLVITPDHEFTVVDRLMTNFHLPRSSLLMLTCSFGGRERVLSAYAEAVTQGYRFYSYGDCMLILSRGR